MDEVAKSLEAEAIPRLGPKGIFPNVDFYSGLVYRKLGIPRDLKSLNFFLTLHNF